MVFILLYFLAMNIINLFLEKNSKKNFTENFSYFYCVLLFYVYYNNITNDKLENKMLIFMFFLVSLYLSIMSLYITRKIYLKLKEYYHNEKRD